MTLAEVAIRVMDGAPFQIALATFLDAFCDAAPEHRQGMIDEAPAGIGDVRLDALMGAIGAHLALTWGLEVPDWTQARHGVPEDCTPTILDALTPGSDPR